MGFCYIFFLLLLLCECELTLSYKRYSVNKFCEEKSFGYTDIFYHREPTNIIELSPSTPSVLIEQAWDNSSYKQYQNCEFKVKTPTKLLYGSYGSTSGLFVAIRELNFRRNEIGECMDYLIFELSGINPASHKICGQISGDEGIPDAKNYFEIPDGFIKIIVHIDKHVLGRNEIEMKLTATAFEDCTGSFKFRCRSYRCISEDLYDDSIMNCIPPLCTDEPRYFSKCGARPAFLPTNQHIMAIGCSLVLVVFASSMCYYFLKLFLVRCGVREIDDQFAPVVVYRSVPTPSAPADTLSESQISTDDPPSYDSLYKSN